MAPPLLLVKGTDSEDFYIFYCDVIFRAVRHLFEGIAIRQEEAREKNLSPPEFKVLQYMAQFFFSGVDPDVTLKVVPNPYPEQPLI